MANDIRNSLKLSQVDSLIFASDDTVLELPTGARGLFGGQILGQALVAATNCVPPQYSLHSTHAYFLAAASATTPLIFLVTPLRRGRSYQVLSVQVLQLGKAVFVLSCSFQLPEPRQPTFQLPSPTGVPAPDACELREVRWQALIDKEGQSWSENRLARLKVMVEERKGSPIAIMDATPEEWPSHRGAYWLKARGISPGELDAAMQKAVLGYLSDFLFIGQGARALRLNSAFSSVRHADRMDMDMMVSLDHQIAWYSDSYDAAAWLLHVMDVQRAGSGRAVVHGQLYTQEGELVAVTSQEGVVRARLPKVEDTKRESKL